MPPSLFRHDDCKLRKTWSTFRCTSCRTCSRPEEARPPHFGRKPSSSKLFFLKGYSDTRSVQRSRCGQQHGKLKKKNRNEGWRKTGPPIHTEYFYLGWSNHLDLGREWCQRRVFVRHALNNLLEHGGAADNTTWRTNFCGCKCCTSSGNECRLQALDVVHLHVLARHAVLRLRRFFPCHCFSCFFWENPALLVNFWSSNVPKQSKSTVDERERDRLRPQSFWLRMLSANLQYCSCGFHPPSEPFRLTPTPESSKGSDLSLGALGSRCRLSNDATSSSTRLSPLLGFDHFPFHRARRLLLHPFSFIILPSLLYLLQPCFFQAIYHLSRNS